MTQATNVKKQILASKIAYKRSLHNEERLEKALAKFFNNLKKEVLKALDEYWSDYQLLQGQVDLITAPVHTAHKDYYELLTLYIKKEYRLGSKEAKRLVDNANRKQQFAHKSISLPVQAFIKNDNDLFATLQGAEERLLNKVFTASERTLSRVDSQINQIITDGYRSGLGINDVSNKLIERFDQLQTWESKRIARTEIHNAHNVAVMDTYEELDVEYTMWVSASDDRVRDSHIEIDGEIIPMGGEYSNGLRFPGDTDGPLNEWINCRCSNAPYVIPYGYMAPTFSPFREEDLIKIETKPDQSPKEIEPVDTVETPTTEAPVHPYHINSEDRFSNININQEVFETVLAHKEARATAKIEWGNLVDLENGKLIHAKDIRGTNKGVTVPRPHTQNKFGLLHNHPSEAGFSGADMYNQLGYSKQGACFASSPKGLWVARDTEFGVASKMDYGGIPDSVKYEIRNKMNAKSREFSQEVYERKYKDRMLNATSRKEVNAIKKEFRADPEWREKYDNWLLETYGVGKNKYNYFEIEFIPNEELKYVKF